MREINSVSKGDIPPYTRWGWGYSFFSPRLIPTAHPFWVCFSHTRSGDIPGSPGVPGCCNCGKSHFPPSRGTPGLPLGAPSHQYFWEDAHPWEIHSPAIPPSGYPPRQSRHLYSAPYVLFRLYKHDIIGSCEKRDRKNIRKNSLKNTSL